MANTGNDASSQPDDADKVGPLDQVLSALGLKRKGRLGGGEGLPKSELVDQAEAFQHLTVADVMIPRADIVALEISTPLKEVEACFVETEHSRLPVYRETLDDPAGFVHIKDVFKLGASGLAKPNPDEPVLGRLRRESLYVPASMRAADLLLRMQASRIHLAMIIDEFGGVDGLATLEDVIEAVVGEIDDEHDEAAKAHIVARAGGIFEVDARASLSELSAALGRDLAGPESEEEIETVAGLVTAAAGRVPQRGEVIALDDALEAEITDADPRRVKRVRLRPVARPPKPAEEGA